MSKRRSGFTLIEVMITVAILAILATIGLPIYTDYVKRGKIVEGSGTLANLRVQMEQFYQDNRNYGGAACGGACGIACPATKFFTYTCTTSNSNQNYTLTATSVANQGLGPVGAFTYTVTDADVRATTKFDNVTKTGVACWLSSKGDAC